MFLLKMAPFTGDVCFESVDASCIATDATQMASGRVTTKWRFSPKSNKCVQYNVDESSCQSKNMFHNHQACESVCPGKWEFQIKKNLQRVLLSKLICFSSHSFVPM